MKWNMSWTSAPVSHHSHQSFLWDHEYGLGVRIHIVKNVEKLSHWIRPTSIPCNAYLLLRESLAYPTLSRTPHRGRLMVSAVSRSSSPATESPHPVLLNFYFVFSYLQVISFEMWCWRRTEKISWTDRVRNEEVLLRVKEQRNTLHEISKRKANWIGHILRGNCLLQRVIEGKIKGGIEVIGRRGRRGRRRRKILDEFKERRG